MAGTTVIVAAVGWPGHLFPALALASALAERGHRVGVETFERWREPVEALGAELLPATEQISFAGLPADEPGAPSLAEAARRSRERIECFGGELVVSDLFTLAPALGAELAGVKRVSLIPHPYPVPAPGRPPFASGFLAPRTALGAAAWSTLRRSGRARSRVESAHLDATRAELGLRPLPRASGAISEQLALVATFPQLEYPRAWPQTVEVTGPLAFELPHPPVELPPGREPLVVVAASSAQDPELELVRAALAALGGEPVRALVALNRPGREWHGPVPANVRVVDWVSYDQVLAEAALVVCPGGHGTIARSLAAAVPVLVCPWAGDMAENGARVAWAGAGAMLPARLLSAATLRRAIRGLLATPRVAARARELATWSQANDAGERGAKRIESLLG